MKEKYWKRFLSDYFIIQAETAFAIAIIGTIFARDVDVKLYYFFIPAILGILYEIPCIIVHYMDSCASAWLIAARFIEAIYVMAVSYYVYHFVFGNQIATYVYVIILVAVLILTNITYLIEDYLEHKEIIGLNEKLKRMREAEEQEEGSSN